MLRCVLLQTEMLWERSQDGATGSGVGKDSKGQRKLKDCGGGLLPSVQGQQRTEKAGGLWRRFVSFSARTAKDRESFLQWKDSKGQRNWFVSFSARTAKDRESWRRFVSFSGRTAKDREI